MQTTVVPDGPEVSIWMKTLELYTQEWASCSSVLCNRSAIVPVPSPPLHFYRYLIDRVGRKWHWQDYLCLNDRDLSFRIHSSRRVIQVLQFDGAPAGLIDVDFDSNNVAEIVYLGVMEHAAGLGYGRSLLNTGLKIASEARVQKVILKTCSLDHPAALKIYQRAGFRSVNEGTMRIRLLTDAQRAKILLG